MSECAILSTEEKMRARTKIVLFKINANENKLTVIECARSLSAALLCADTVSFDRTIRQYRIMAVVDQAWTITTHYH